MACCSNLSRPDFIIQKFSANMQYCTPLKFEVVNFFLKI